MPDEASQSASEHLNCQQEGLGMCISRKARRKYGTGSLFKNGRTFWVRYWADGVRRAVNTHVADRDEAERMIERIINTGEVGPELADIKRTAIGAAAELSVAADLIRKGWGTCLHH